MKDHDKKLIRNSTGEFLILTAQAGVKSIEARYEDDIVWVVAQSCSYPGEGAVDNS